MRRRGVLMGDGKGFIVWLTVMVCEIGGFRMGDCGDMGFCCVCL